MSRSGLIKYLHLFRQPAKKQKIYVFLLCLFCSAVFWFTIKLTRENQAVFRDPLALYDVPEGTVLFDQTDSLVTYSLQTTGLRLAVSRYFSARDSIRLSVASLPRLTRGGESYHYITANMLSTILTEQLDGPSVVLTVRPDTIFFHLMQGLQKTVPVQLQADLSYESRFDLYGEISLQPDSVSIYGPVHLIDTIHYINTELLSFKGLQKSVDVIAGLDTSNIHPSVAVSPLAIDVVIAVEEYTEAHVEVPLEVQCEDGAELYSADRLRLFPNKVELVFLVALKDFHKVEAGLFGVYVDCPDKIEANQQLKVRVGLIPDFVRKVSVRPTKVDYLIMN